MLVTLAAGAGYALWIAVMVLIERRHTHITNRAAIAAVSVIGSPECIVGLQHQLHWGVAARTEASYAMRNVLPTVDESWYGRLPSGSTYALIALAGSGDEELALAALNALEKAGDGAAAADVRRLARISTRESVCQRAREVLPILESRLDHERSASVLLRAAVGDNEQHLLQPANNTESPAEEMLRSSEQI
jgi:hypothetical protein